MPPLVLYRRNQSRRYAGRLLDVSTVKRWCKIEVEGGRLPTPDWMLNLQILTSGGFRSVAENRYHVIRGNVQISPLLPGSWIGRAVRRRTPPRIRPVGAQPRGAFPGTTRAVLAPPPMAWWHARAALPLGSSPARHLAAHLLEDHVLLVAYR